MNFHPQQLPASIPSTVYADSLLPSLPDFLTASAEIAPPRRLIAKPPSQHVGMPAKRFQSPPPMPAPVAKRIIKERKRKLIRDQPEKQWPYWVKEEYRRGFAESLDDWGSVKRGEVRRSVRISKHKSA